VPVNPANSVARIGEPVNPFGFSAEPKDSVPQAVHAASRSG
jgi:hypothetical protein